VEKLDGRSMTTAGASRGFTSGYGLDGACPAARARISAMKPHVSVR
jgi:hypothetical protein